MLIHSFWVTARSWEDWKADYEGKGYTVLTPGYPGFDVEVEALNEDPTLVGELTVPKIVPTSRRPSAGWTGSRSSWATPPAASLPSC